MEAGAALVRRDDVYYGRIVDAAECDATAAAGGGVVVAIGIIINVISEDVVERVCGYYVSVLDFIEFPGMLWRFGPGGAWA